MYVCIKICVSRSSLQPRLSRWRYDQLYGLYRTFQFLTVNRTETVTSICREVSVAMSSTVPQLCQACCEIREPCIYRVAQNKPDYYFCCPSSVFVQQKTREYDNVRVAPRTLVKAVLNVSSIGCNNERQLFAKMSYSTIDNVLTSLLQAGFQDFFQMLNVSHAATTTVNKLLECSADRIVHWV